MEAFKLNVIGNACGTLESPGNYTVMDGETVNYKQNGATNTNCLWQTGCEGDKVAEVTFNSFSSESGFDFLHVHSTGDLRQDLGSFSGAQKPEPLKNVHTIQYTSDASEEAENAGVNFTLNCAKPKILEGDLNRDGSHNVTDIVILVNYILELSEAKEVCEE